MIVVADTSVLINLCRVGQGGLFQQLFQEVFIPPEVAAEFDRLADKTTRFAGLKLPPEIKQQSPSSQPSVVRDATGLDSGEAAALSLAVEVHADAVLIDERRGYEVAVQLGLRAIGILGILLRAKSVGVLPAVKPVLDALQRDGVSGFLNRCGIKCSKLLAKAERLSRAVFLPASALNLTSPDSRSLLAQLFEWLNCYENNREKFQRVARAERVGRGY